jgi:hypothetical protein
MSTASTIYYPSLQTFYQECLCRRKKSNNCYFPTPWFRLQRLYVNACRTVNLLAYSIIIDVDVPPNSISTLYDLIANVTHESVAGTTRDKENTIWKAHIRAAGGGGDNEKWFMIQDLIVEETRKEMIFLGETILQVLSFSFILPNRFNIAAPTDLGTSDRSTMTMTITTIDRFFPFAKLSCTTFKYWSSRVNQRIDNITGRNIYILSGKYRDLGVTLFPSHW